MILDPGEGDAPGGFRRLSGSKESACNEGTGDYRFGGPHGGATAALQLSAWRESPGPEA